MGSKEGRRSPPQFGGLVKFNVQIYAFLCYFCIKQYAESDDIFPLKYRVGNRYRHLFHISRRNLTAELAHVPLQEFPVHV